MVGKVKSQNNDRDQFSVLESSDHFESNKGSGLHNLNFDFLDYYSTVVMALLLELGLLKVTFQSI